MSAKRVTFGSRIGVILATVGCAVGLGNIWRFPYMVGSNGGAAFLLVYFICILFLGLPVMMTELFIGRKTHRNTAGSFKVLAPGTKWKYIGYNGVCAAFIILGFYSVVSGWTLEYILQAFTGSLNGKSATDFTNDFMAFSTGLWRPIFWTVLFVFITHIIIICGVDKGIERASKIMMPVLFLILIALCIRSLTLPNASIGLDFLLRPQLDRINSSVILSAMGQAFFSLSIGMGCLITYASYFNKDVNIQKTAIEVAVLDTVVAVLAGFMIFPAVFSFGIEPTSGASLVFITLPNVFEQMPFGSVWSFVFFVLLALAALTSVISLHEVVTAYVLEEYQMSRKKAALFVSLGIILMGVLCSLSLGAVKSLSLFGLPLFDLFDYVTAKIMLPIGGMFICIFVGTHIEKRILKEEMTNRGTVRFYFFNTYTFFIKYIAPIAIGLIFVNELGLLSYLKGLL